MDASEPQMREWTEVAQDWVTDEYVEVRFRTDGTDVWVWCPLDDGLPPTPVTEHNWTRLTPITSE